MKTINDTIKAANYLATGEQVQALANEHLTGSQRAYAAGSTYLKILLAKTMERLPKRGKVSNKMQVDAIDAVHAEIYPDVLLGVETPALADLQPDEAKAEIARRAMFARSSRSTLRTYARDHDLKGLDIETVSKPQLYKATRPPEPEDRTERVIVRAETSLLRGLSKLAKRSLEDASAMIEELIDKLHELVEGQVERRETRIADTPHRVIGHTLERHHGHAT